MALSERVRSVLALLWFANGYAKAQKGTLKTRVEALQLASNEANPVQVTAQFWCHFETEVHLVNVADGFNVPGIYRKPIYVGAGNPMQRVLDMTQRSGAVRRVDLNTLLAE
jgi:hypothetical protein